MHDKQNKKYIRLSSLVCKTTAQRLVRGGFVGRHEEIESLQEFDLLFLFYTWLGTYS